jgi:hypothetical protein
MEVRRTTADACEIRGIPPFLASLLAVLPREAALHRKAHQRLYPEPAGPGEGEEIRRDWREVVQPELARLFASSRDVVARDLHSMREAGGECRIAVPRANFDAWLNTLNQARLIIVEEQDFTEADLDQASAPDLSTKEGLALLKVHFYAHVQELLIRAGE